MARTWGYMALSLWLNCLLQSIAFNIVKYVLHSLLRLTSDPNKAMLSPLPQHIEQLPSQISGPEIMNNFSSLA